MQTVVIVLAVLVVCSLAANIYQQHTNHQQHALNLEQLGNIMLAQTRIMRDQVRDIQQMRVAEVEANKIVELARVDQARHLDDLNATLQTEDARFRSQERVAALQQPLVQTVPLAQAQTEWNAQWPGWQTAPDGIDAIDIGPDPFARDQQPVPQYPTFNEQQQQQYAPQYQDREAAVMIPVGGSLIPGAPNEAGVTW